MSAKPVVVASGTRPSIDLDALTAEQRQALDADLRILSSVSLGSVSVGVADGAPISRPPLFRETDSWIAVSGKSVLYIVLSPAIVIVLLWDSRVVVFDAAKRGANALLLQPAISLVRNAGRAITYLTHGAHRYVLIPANNGLAAVARGTHRFILLPTYNASVAVLDGARRLALALAAGGKRGSLAIVRAVHSYVLLPLWKGSVAVFDATKRAIVAVCVGTKRGAIGLARGVHGYVLLPLWRGSVAVVDATTRAIVLPAWRAISTAASWAFTGACRLGACVQHGVGSAARVSWGWICFVGGGVHRHILLPAHWAAAAALKHTWRGAVWVAAGVGRYLLTPLGHGMLRGAQLVGRGAIALLRVLGNGIVLLADGGSRAAGWVFLRVLVPLHAGAAALAGHSWRGACWVVGGVWRGTALVASTIHGHVLVPTYQAARALVVGAWVGACWVGAGLWVGARAVGTGLYSHILVPVASGATAVYLGGRFLVITAASGLRRHVVAPLLAGATLAVVALYEGVLKPVGGAVVAGATTVRKGARAAAGGVATGVRAGVDGVKAGALAVRDGAVAGAGAVRNAAAALGKAVSELRRQTRGGRVASRPRQPSRTSTMTGCGTAAAAS